MKGINFYKSVCTIRLTQIASVGSFDLFGIYIVNTIVSTCMDLWTIIACSSLIE